MEVRERVNIASAASFLSSRKVRVVLEGGSERDGLDEVEEERRLVGVEEEEGVEGDEGGVESCNRKRSSILLNMMVGEMMG